MKSSLDDIGFYSLTEDRATIPHENMERCEMILTSSCNYRCPYCRGVKAYSRDCSGNIDLYDAISVIQYWTNRNLRNIRFSGGEPLIYPYLDTLITHCKSRNIEHIAISSNGSFPRERYSHLLSLGVNDFSISLDAYCAADAEKMAGRKGVFERVIGNIEFLSKRTYTTVGVVLTEDTRNTLPKIVEFADSLGVSDIRIITAAQFNGDLSGFAKINQGILDKYPILKYRIGNLSRGRNVRGMSNDDSKRCYLVNDDSVVAGEWHFPCVIYMREGGEPIGDIKGDMIRARREWGRTHDTHLDKICMNNCLDCLIDYNNRIEQMRMEFE